MNADFERIDWAFATHRFRAPRPEAMCAMCEDAPTSYARVQQLLERYGVRIPVLRIAGCERELGWPFDLPEGCGDGVVVSGQYDCFRPIR